jgi:signal transduction histidine kinase
MSGFTLETSYGNIGNTCQIDEDAIIQAVTNLITNSIKYSGENKYVHVCTYTEQHAAVIQVKDRGIGISEQDLKNVFQPYFRVPDPAAAKKSGTGLGLSIVKHTIEAHGGHIEIASTPGEGTTVSLHFPLEVRHEEHTHH